MTLPNGFSFADRLQAQSFAATGSIDGASKVTIVNGEVACRLRPPHRLEAIKSHGPHGSLEKYIADYNSGWAASRRVGRGETETAREWEDGTGSNAYDDGYLDQAAGRPKWHLTYCANHDECGEG